MDVRKGFLKEGVMPLGVSGMSRVEIFWLVTGFGDGQGLFDPIDGGVCDVEPGESEDDVFSAATHDIEEMFLSNLFDVHVESASTV